ncbi:MAG: molybdopterin-dependent oxidoreductase [Armatimonadota bacterium]|nr:molybdopterin-dependent oxidoreductase [Armatimonadota bacterium]MDR7580872.1 molybdopterin-dependent oxidoreductase [Armatimonadota bacterium]MDR7595470.1 molybdopterin-dependent oxidoreductase [Armatimonadota bacterium]
MAVSENSAERSRALSLEEVLRLARRIEEKEAPLTGEQVEVLWRTARDYLGRREFLRLLTLGGAAAVVAAVSESRGVRLVAHAAPAGAPARLGPLPTSLPEPRTEDKPYVKDLSRHWQLDPLNYALRYENLRYGDTNVPTPLYYVRTHHAGVIVDHTKWKLVVEGPGVSRRLELTFDDILRLPSVNQNAYTECSGNGRSFFRDVMGRPAEGLQWRWGSNSQANWDGVEIREVLQRAGLKREAVAVNFIDVGAKRYNRPIDIQEVLRPGNILAYGMNGTWLPWDHGFPLRVIAPRYTCASNVKWLGTIYVDTKPIWVEWNTEKYIFEGPDFPPQPPARGVPVTFTAIRSALALKWVEPADPTPHRLRPGPNRIWGFAWSPFAKIRSVDYAIVRLTTLDDWRRVDPADRSRVTWQRARLSSRQRSEIEWVRFEFEWDASPGLYGILTRATDEKGNAQPLEMPKWNKLGYGWNRPVAHPVQVG